MIDGNYVQDVERLNQSPLNQEAKKRLREAKEPQYPESLYLLQLAKWGLENGVKVDSKEVSRQMLEDTLLNLREVSPEKADHLLSKDLAPESLQGHPKDAAAAVLLNLADIIQGNFYQSKG